METTHKLIQGDSRNLSLIKDRSVHLIITSPPYWQLKDYGNDGQIGFHDSYESYINNLNAVWTECYRVLHDGCRLCINIGDQFARSVYYGLLRDARNGLYGGCDMAKANYDEYDRRRGCYGKFSLSA